MTRYAFDDSYYRKFFDDFDNYEADQWVKTETGSGTIAVQAADNGVILLTNAAADDDHNFLQWSGDDLSGVAETFKFVIGKLFYFKARLKVSDAMQSDFIMGLQVTDTSPLAAADGIWFQKDDADALLDFHVAKSSVQSDKAGIHTVADDTWFTVAFYYDGSGNKILALVDDESVGYLPLTNAPDDEELAISFGIQNGTDAAKTMSVDFVSIVRER